MVEAARPPRLFVPQALAAGISLSVDRRRTHYLAHVLRLRPGAEVHLFNGEAGEWRARLARLERLSAELEVEVQLRLPEPESGPRLAVAPIRSNRLDWLVEKAVELGVGVLDLVLTRRTVARMQRADRLVAIAIEAAEQCGRLSIPEVVGPRPLETWLETLPTGRALIVADKGGGEPVLAALGREPDAVLLVGPEGGFAPEERRRLVARPRTITATMGPLILRAETAAVALLALRQALDHRSRGGRFAGDRR